MAPYQLPGSMCHGRRGGEVVVVVDGGEGRGGTTVAGPARRVVDMAPQMTLYYY